MPTNLNNLSTELLIKIFENCSTYDLCRLKQTCVRFNSIIKSTSSIKNNNVVVTNQFCDSIRNRSTELLSSYEKWRISHNWIIGKYRETALLQDRHRHIPWLILTKEFLWFSRGKYIRAYKRRKKKLDVNRPHYILGGHNTSDVCKFAFKHGHLVSGQRDGSIWVWSSDRKMILHDLVGCHESDVNSVDISSRLFVSGSKDRTFKVWPLYKNPPYEPFYTYSMNDRIWSVALSKEGDALSVGTAGYNNVAPLHIFDLNRFAIKHTLGTQFRKGSGILDIKWENPSILMTCGYDMNIRKWDCRSGRCVQSWEDPLDSTIYCFETDNLCTILGGTQSHGRVVLWDTRKTNYMQMYFMEACKRQQGSSPVYSLSFDPIHLFAATDHNLNILNFAIKDGTSKNYRDIFYKQIKITL